MSDCAEKDHEVIKPSDPVKTAGRREKTIVRGENKLRYHSRKQSWPVRHHFRGGSLNLLQKKQSIQKRELLETRSYKGGGIKGEELK